MVKFKSKIFCPFFLLCPLLLTVTACNLNVDLLGLFGSNDLNVRLKDKNNFNYLKDNERDITFPEEFSFLVLTDTHVENGNIEDLKKIKTVIDNNSDIKFLINLGDMTQTGSDKDIKAVTEFFRSLSVPCYTVIGNHDVYFGDWPVWKKYIGSTCYKIKGDSVTLFILDSANAFMGKDQLDWLEKELKTAKRKIFVFTHSDFFVKDKIKIQQLYDQGERARIMSMLRNKCSIVFTGHSHERVEKEFGGVKYISIEDYKSTQTYCLVTVTKTGVKREFKKSQ